MFVRVSTFYPGTTPGGDLCGGLYFRSMFMNIITWNVRGLGRPAKRFLGIDFLTLHDAEVCCLQDSKLESISQAKWREIGGSKMDQFIFAPAKGMAGGLIIGWNGAILVGKLEKVGAFSLMVEFRDKRDNFRWRCTSVYGLQLELLNKIFGRS